MRETQKTLTLDLDGSPTNVTVKRATARDGVNRYLLASKGNKDNENETDEALRIMRLILYPDLSSVTTAIVSETEGYGCPIPFETFIELPEDFVNAWADLVYQMNPLWKPQVGGTDEDEKKAPSSKKE